MIDHRAKRDVWVFYEDTNTMEKVEMKSLEPGDVISIEYAPGYWVVKQWPCQVLDQGEQTWSVIVEEEEQR